MKTSRTRNVPITNEVKVLKFMRIQAGHSLNSAGKILNVHGTTISHIENGKMCLPTQRIEQMVSGYGYSMAEFFKLCQEKEPPTDMLSESIFILNRLGRRRLPKAHQFLIELSKAHPLASKN